MIFSRNIFYFSILFLCLSNLSSFTTRLNTPHVVINCAFNSNASTANHPNFNNFSHVMHRPEKLPVQQIYGTQPKADWSAERFERYFIQASSQDSLLSVPSGIGPEQKIYSHDYFQFTPERQQEILQRYDLYQYPGFIEYIQKLPDFPQFVTNLQTQLSNDAFYKHFNELANQFPEIKALYHDNRNNFARVITEWYEKLPQIRDGDKLQQYLDDLSLVRQPVIEACSNLKTIEQAANTLNVAQREIIGKAGADIKKYENFSGDPLQRATHGRCLDALEEFTQLPADSIIRTYEKRFGQCVEVARTFNEKKEITISNRILDFCFLAVDCGRAVATGAAQGLKHAVIDIMDHRLDVTLSFLVSKTLGGPYMVAYEAFKAFHASVDLGVTYAFDPEQGSAKLNHYIQPVKEFAHQLYNGRISQCMESISRVATSLIIKSKILNTINVACETACTKGVHLAQKIQQLNKVPKLATPEGILLKANNSNVANQGKNKTNIANSCSKPLPTNTNAQKVQWTNHGHKHSPQKNMSWKDIVQYTKHGKAKYKDGINIEAMERMAWEKGIPVAGGKTWKVMKCDTIIGAKKGIETQYIRVEMSANTIHGHPITFDEYKDLLK